MIGRSLSGKCLQWVDTNISIELLQPDVELVWSLPHRTDSPGCFPFASHKAHAKQPVEKQ